MFEPGKASCSLPFRWRCFARVSRLTLRAPFLMTKKNSSAVFRSTLTFVFLSDHKNDINGQKHRRKKTIEAKDSFFGMILLWRREERKNNMPRTIQGFKSFKSYWYWKSESEYSYKKRVISINCTLTHFLDFRACSLATFFFTIFNVRVHIYFMCVLKIKIRSYAKFKIWLWIQKNWDFWDTITKNVQYWINFQILVNLIFRWGMGLSGYLF